MKRLFVMLMVAAVALAASVECNAQFSRLSIGDYGIQSIDPESFRAV